MNSFLYHLQLNIDFVNVNFYKELMSFLGWSIIFEKENTCGYRSGKNGDIWFLQADKSNLPDFDAKGMNHLSIRVEKKSDVDNVVGLLKQKSIQPLFDTPRHRPEFSNSKQETYYQVMFKTADNLLFEIVYIGLKTEQ